MPEDAKSCPPPYVEFGVAEHVQLNSTALCLQFCADRPTDTLIVRFRGFLDEHGSASLASPVVVSESVSAVVTNTASASPALTTLPLPRCTKSKSSSVDFLPLPIPIPITAPNPISPVLYNDFVLYPKYSSAAYQPFCAQPVDFFHLFYLSGNIHIMCRCLLSYSFCDSEYCDPARLEIVVVFRGRFRLKDAVTDAKLLLLPFELPGIVELVHVHRGFLCAYQNVSDQVVAIAKELKEYPETPGRCYCLGRAITSLATPSIKAALPDAVMKLYTFALVLRRFTKSSPHAPLPPWSPRRRLPLPTFTLHSGPVDDTSPHIARGQCIIFDSARSYSETGLDRHEDVENGHKVRELGREYGDWPRQVTAEDSESWSDG
ncbi:hypothetical protein B0H14DRAFT_3427459 [Mycena olivaceomarginata]|nr:hypothetical protein B0H14DRAFT_3427459 [Mycena olivaceomarginata]